MKDEKEKEKEVNAFAEEVKENPWAVLMAPEMWIIGGIIALVCYEGYVAYTWGGV